MIKQPMAQEVYCQQYSMVAGPGGCMLKIGARQSKLGAPPVKMFAAVYLKIGGCVFKVGGRLLVAACLKDGAHMFKS